MSSDTDVRTLLEGLSDETIHGVIDSLVRGLVQSIADEIIEHAVAAIISHLEAAASGPPDDEPTPEPTPEPAPKLEWPASGLQVLAPKPPAATHKKQDSEERTCELCGRVGFRRFEQTASGWKCAPTAKCGDRPAQTAAHPPEPAPAPPTPATMPRVTGITPGVTARCQDCTRTFTLTDRLLDQAVEMHERRHGHIVRVMGEASDA